MTFRKFVKKAENVARDNDDLDTPDYMMSEDSYMIPVIFHNLNGYDSHLIMKYVTRVYAQNSIDVIPTTSEKCLSFQIRNLPFLDSLQFPKAWSKVWLRMAEINLAIPRGITRTLIWFSQRGITLTSIWMEDTHFS